jgi:hypothetical protein
MEPNLKPPGTNRSKPGVIMLLPTSAFKFDLRRYNKEEGNLTMYALVCPPESCLITGRGLNSLSFQLNLSSSVHRITQRNSWMCPRVAQVER